MQYRRSSTPTNRQALDGILPYSRRDVTYESRSAKPVAVTAVASLVAELEMSTTKPISWPAPSLLPLTRAVKRHDLSGIRYSLHHASDNTKHFKSQPINRRQPHGLTSTTASIPSTTLPAQHSSSKEEQQLNQKPEISVPVKWYTRLKHQPPGLLALYAMAILIFLGGAFVSFNGLRTNKQIAAQVKQQQKVDSTGSSNQSGAPSTVKPTTAAIAGYAVAPNLPKYIDIPKLGIHARTLSMNVNSKNQLQAPGNVYDAGWYNASAQPGQPGSMLIDGHISSWTTHGVFYGLSKLVAGDAITVTRGDNKTFTYKVVKTALVATANVDMASLLVSQDTAKPGLSLISCAGDVIAGTNEFDKRQIIYAVMQ